MNLSNLRRLIAAFVLLVGTLFLLDLPFLKTSFFSVFPKMQAVPAILAGASVIIVFLGVLTILFGRLYCSVICPLGIFQDIVIRLNRARIAKNKDLRKARRFYQYEKPINLMRYSILALSIVTAAIGSTAVLIFLDPYSIYTRLSTYIFHPIGIAINNLMAKVFNSFDSYAFVTEHYIVPALFVLIITILITGIIVILAVKKDRFWCNAICPVGTLLGLFSRFSIFRVAVDQQQCVACGKCSRACKSHAIDQDNDFKIDYSRCVSCYNCIDSCDKQKAISVRSITNMKNLAEAEK